MIIYMHAHICMPNQYLEVQSNFWESELSCVLFSFQTCMFLDIQNGLEMADEWWFYAYFSFHFRN
jgi:hypothetical protein